MNIYDTKQVFCSKCNNSIGEIEFDAKIINPLCGTCSNPMPSGDSILYVRNKFRK